MAGELVVAAEQVEWDGVLIGRHPGESPLWLPADADATKGWVREWDVRPAETATGAVPGLPRPMGMYPTLEGVTVEGPEWMAWLLAAMEPTYVPRPLVWWDPDLDQVVEAEACPQWCQPWRRRAAEPRRVNLQWFIGDPETIVVGGSS